MPLAHPHAGWLNLRLSIALKHTTVASDPSRTQSVGPAAEEIFLVEGQGLDIQ
jgi:hypothetical protein